MQQRHVRMGMGSIMIAMLMIWTWPIISHLATAVPATTDPQDAYEKLWNLWRVAYAVRGHEPLLTTTLLWSPQASSLAFHPLSLTNTLLAAPLTSAVGPLVTYNLLIIISMVANALAMGALLRHMQLPTPIPLLGAILWMTNPLWIQHVQLSHLELWASWWLPLAILGCERAITTTTGVRIGVAIVGCIAVVYSSLYLALYLALYLLVRLPRAWRVLVSIGSGTLIGAIPLLGAMLHESHTNQAVVRSLDEAAGRSATPRTLVSMVGVALIIGAIGGIQRRTIHWLIIAVLSGWLALGPAGGLYRLIYALPGGAFGRYPDRFLFMTTLAVVILAMHGLHRGLQSVPQRPVITVVGLGVLLLGTVVLRWPSGWHMVSMTPTAAAHVIATQPPGSVLDLPITRENSAWQAMYDQTVHQHPIIDGALARPVAHLPFRWLPLVRDLEAGAVQPEIITHSAAERQATLRYLDLRYLVYHTADGPVPTDATLLDILTIPVERVYTDAATVILRLVVPPVPAAEPLPVAMQLGSGWHDLELLDQPHRWLDGPASLAVWVPHAGALTLTMQLVAYDHPQTARLLLDDQPIGTVMSDPTPDWQTVSIPAVAAGPHTLHLQPQECGIAPPGDDRRLTVGVLSLSGSVEPAPPPFKQQSRPAP